MHLSDLKTAIFSAVFLFAATLATSVSAETDRELLLKSCKMDSQTTDDECDCFIGKAEEQLTEKEFKFFAAMMLKKNPIATAQELGMQPAEMQSLGLKMEKLPAQCQG